MSGNYAVTQLQIKKPRRLSGGALLCKRCLGTHNVQITYRFLLPFLLFLETKIGVFAFIMRGSVTGDGGLSTAVSHFLPK